MSYGGGSGGVTSPARRRDGWTWPGDRFACGSAPGQRWGRPRRWRDRAWRLGQGGAATGGSVVRRCAAGKRTRNVRSPHCAFGCSLSRRLAPRRRRATGVKVPGRPRLPAARRAAAGRNRLRADAAWCRVRMAPVKPTRATLQPGDRATFPSPRGLTVDRDAAGQAPVQAVEADGLHAMLSGAATPPRGSPRARRRTSAPVRPVW